MSSKSSNIHNVSYRFPTQYRQLFQREPLTRNGGRHLHRVSYRLPTDLHKPVYFEQRRVWRIDWVGSLIGTVILTIGTTIAGPIGFVVGIALWWFILALRR